MSFVGYVRALPLQQFLVGREGGGTEMESVLRVQG